MVMLLSLLNLAHSTAFSVIISLSTFGLYQSFLLAITCVLTTRLSGKFEEVSLRALQILKISPCTAVQGNPLTYLSYLLQAPWSLGKFGVPINVFTILFSAWLGIFMIFPNYLPISATNMNVSIPGRSN